MTILRVVGCGTLDWDLADAFLTTRCQHRWDSSFWLIWRTTMMAQVGVGQSHGRGRAVVAAAAAAGGGGGASSSTVETKANESNMS